MTFFPVKTTKAELPMITDCRSCKLDVGGCLSPKLKMVGKGKKRILIVGDKPTKFDDETGTLHPPKVISAFNGFNVLDDCWYVTSVICAPKNGFIKDNTPIISCRPNVFRIIKEMKPTVVILMGLDAIRSVIGNTWKENPGRSDRWEGWCIPNHKPNCWILPVHDGEHYEKSKNPVDTMRLKASLKKAVKLSKRYPWNDIPDYEGQVQVVYGRDTIKKMLAKIAAIKKETMVAFDYETNMLKPDHPESSIFSCSFCIDGKETFAFPWHASFVKPVREILRKKNLLMIASNMKFEERWTRVHLKTRVRNWHWDTMLAAHVLDNRPEITSIKFQSYVRLGQPDYASEIHKYLTTSDGAGYTKNKIQQANLQQLLVYNGLDSILEYEVALKQIAELEDKVNDS